MDKSQALSYFWNSFGWTALDEQGDYDERERLEIGDRYILFENQTGDYTGPVSLTASLYHRSSSWETISLKMQEIADAIGQGTRLVIDGGYLWIKRQNPFSRHMEDQSRDWRRILLNIEVDFLTVT